MLTAEKRRMHEQMILKFITADLAAGRPFPSQVKIQHHLGWRHVQGVKRALERLAGDQIIDRNLGHGPTRWSYSMPSANQSNEVRHGR
jgi:hypothetical protein